MRSPDLGRSVERAVAFVERHQRSDGAIASLPDGSLDPWDHVESAMALDVGGRHDAAAAAYDWLARNQHADGGLWSKYRSGERFPTRAVAEVRESHVASYLAVGAWHHFLQTGDRDWLADYWPTICAAVDFALSMQVESGAVHWALDADGNPWPDSLVPVAASVRASVRCGEFAATLLGEPEADAWPSRRRHLDESFVASDAWGQTFDECGDRFSMHWYYPVLAGIVRDEDGRERLRRDWGRFVIDRHGCRCVADRRWVTIAESSELVLALHAAGMETEARDLLAWQLDWQEPDGGFRMGTALNWGAWPDQRPSWTAAAVVLAAAALAERTPGAHLFASLGKT
jgi:hypothetical protein